MKRIALLLIAFITFTASQAQIRKTPAEVTNAFTAKFPGATNVIWSDKLTNFEAAYTLNGVRGYASFDSDGAWKRTETKVASLPTEVQDGWNKSKYNGWTVKSIRKIERPEKETLYKIEARKNKAVKKNIFFKETGVMESDNITI